MVDYTKRNNSSAEVIASQYDAGLRKYMLTIYNYMTLGLAITGFVSYAVSMSHELMAVMFNTPLKWVILLAPLAFVFIFAAKSHSLSVHGAKICFFSFSALMGLSLAPIFLIYTGASIAKAFLITSSVFGAMSLYGYTTKRDLTGIGSFLMMGLIGLIIASLVNLFLQSDAMGFVLSIISVIVFVGLTAYDTQKLKHLYYYSGIDHAKVAVYGALDLYLDFINLFMTILRFVGDRE